MSMFWRVVVCLSTVGCTLLMSWQNVQTDVLPPVCGHADYTKSVCVFKHDISPFIDPECQNMLDIMHGKHTMLNTV